MNIYSDSATNQKLFPFTIIDGLNKKCMVAPSKKSNDYFGELFTIKLEKGQFFNFYDVNGDGHMIKREKEDHQSILIYNNFLIYDADELYVTDFKKNLLK